MFPNHSSIKYPATGLKRRFINVIACWFIVLALPSAGLADAAAEEKWSGHITLSGKPGNKRNIGEVDLFIPVLQDNRSLLFLDLRTKLDNHSSIEGNFGIGYRKIVNEDWIIGAYGFLDRRQTQHDNYFTQGTFGVEALSNDLDYRVNAYIPESTEKPIAGTSSATAYLSDTNFRMLSRNETLERALPGIDAEVGMRLPLSDLDLRLYAGGFYFDAPGYDAIKGPRARVELAFDHIPGLGRGSQLTLGAEAQYDNVRGDHYFGLVQLKIPFGFISGKKQRRLSGLDRRMTNYVQRDIDIVAGEQIQPLIDESATAEINGTRVSQVDAVVSPGDDIATKVTNAGANSTVMVDETVDTNTAVTMQNGQTLVGSGLTFTGDVSGLQARGSGGVINQTNAGIDVINLANNATVSDLSVQGGDDGLRVWVNTGVVIRDVTIRNSAAMGIRLAKGSHNAVVERVAIENSGEDGIFIHDSDNVVVNDLTILNTGGRGIFVWIDSDNTIISNTTINNTATQGISLGEDDSDGHTLNNVSINNAGDDGLVINRSDNVTVNSVAVNGAGGNAFRLVGGADSVSGLSGSGNSFSGTIGGNVCETSGTVTGSFSFTSGGNCP